MAVPKFKISKAKSRRRRSVNMKIAVPNLITCTNCGNRITRHHVCPQCGSYKNKQVIEPEDLA